MATKSSGQFDAETHRLGMAAEIASNAAAGIEVAKRYQAQQAAKPAPIHGPVQQTPAPKKKKKKAAEQGPSVALAPIYNIEDVYARDGDHAAATQRSIADLRAERETVEAEYQARRAEIRNQFTLAETAGEKKVLMSQLAALNTQAKHAHKAINQVYGNSIRGALAQGKYALADGRAVAGQSQAAWNTAAQVAGVNADAVGATGAAFGMGGVQATGPAALGRGDFAMRGAAAHDAALARGQAGSDTLKGIAAAMKLARASSHVETGERVAEMSAGARADHAAAVADRVNSDRRYLADALGAAADRYSDTRRDINGNIISTRLGAAEYEGARRDDALSFIRSANNENVKYNADTLRAAGGGGDGAAVSSKAVQELAAKFRAQKLIEPAKTPWMELEQPDGGKVPVRAQAYETLYYNAKAQAQLLRQQGRHDEALIVDGELFADENFAAWARSHGIGSL